VVDGQISDFKPYEPHVASAIATAPSQSPAIAGA